MLASAVMIGAMSTPPSISRHVHRKRASRRKAAGNSSPQSVVETAASAALHPTATAAVRTLQVAVSGPFYTPLDYILPAGLSTGEQLPQAGVQKSTHIAAASATPASEQVQQQLIATQLQAGMRVLVPLGRRQVVGVVLGASASSNIAAERLRPLDGLLEPDQWLTPSLLQLASWAADYYHYPLGEIIISFLPKALRLPKLLTPKQLATVTESVVENKKNILATPVLAANTEQQQAIDKLKAQHTFKVSVLWGVTGSGKTEVYLQVLANVLARGGQVLVLVPEIGLTPQAVARFTQRFHVPVYVWHSKLTQKQQLETWLQLRKEDPCVVIGTRSALFSPLPNLGLVIIDEEHDASFKQASKWRYHARDVAVMRARFANIPLILGSATPSLETLHNVQRKRYQCFQLPKRATGAAPVTWHVIDKTKMPLQHGFSEPLLEKMRQHLQAGQQILVFLNRRGYAPVLFCTHCGWRANCKHCDSSMTLHYHPAHLRCHHCLARRQVPQVCPDCQQTTPVAVGLGTEQLELGLQELLPDYPVLRIDRDSTRRKGSLEKSLQQAEQGAAKILLGTQMLAKGHHFPGLSLVVVMDIDSGLYGVDFHSTEYLGQLLVQVAGRAGREQYPGEVALQTFNPQHPQLRSVIEQGYAAFSQQLLSSRAKLGLPPYHFMVLLRCEGKLASDAADGLRLAKRYLQQRWQQMQQTQSALLRELMQKLEGAAAIPNIKIALAKVNRDASVTAKNQGTHQPTGGVEAEAVATATTVAAEIDYQQALQILGPVAAPMERLDGRYRAQLLVQSPSRPLLQYILTGIAPFLQQQASLRKLRWSIDVDPSDMY